MATNNSNAKKEQSVPGSRMASLTPAKPTTNNPAVTQNNATSIVETSVASIAAAAAATSQQQSLPASTSTTPSTKTTTTKPQRSPRSDRLPGNKSSMILRLASDMFRQNSAMLLEQASVLERIASNPNNPSSWKLPSHLQQQQSSHHDGNDTITGIATTAAAAAAAADANNSASNGRQSIDNEQQHHTLQQTLQEKSMKLAIESYEGMMEVQNRVDYMERLMIRNNIGNHSLRGKRQRPIASATKIKTAFQLFSMEHYKRIYSDCQYHIQKMKTNKNDDGIVIHDDNRDSNDDPSGTTIATNRNNDKIIDAMVKKELDKLWRSLNPHDRLRYQQEITNSKKNKRDKQETQDVKKTKRKENRERRKEKDNAQSDNHKDDTDDKGHDDDDDDKEKEQQLLFQSYLNKKKHQQKSSLKSNTPMSSENENSENSNKKSSSDDDDDDDSSSSISSNSSSSSSGSSSSSDDDSDSDGDASIIDLVT